MQDLRLYHMLTVSLIALKDYLTVGQTTPREDDQQDFKMIYAKEENGKTTLYFYRKRDTRSEDDFSFKVCLLEINSI